MCCMQGATARLAQPPLLGGRLALRPPPLRTMRWVHGVQVDIKIECNPSHSSVVLLFCSSSTGEERASHRRGRPVLAGGRGPGT